MHAIKNLAESLHVVRALQVLHHISLASGQSLAVPTRKLTSPIEPIRLYQTHLPSQLMDLLNLSYRPLDAKVS